MYSIDNMFYKRECVFKRYVTDG